MLLTARYGDVLINARQVEYRQWKQWQEQKREAGLSCPVCDDYLEPTSTSRQRWFRHETRNSSCHFSDVPQARMGKSAAVKALIREVAKSNAETTTDTQIILDDESLWADVVATAYNGKTTIFQIHRNSDTPARVEALSRKAEETGHLLVWIHLVDVATEHLAAYPSLRIFFEKGSVPMTKIPMVSRGVAAWQTRVGAHFSTYPPTNLATVVRAILRCTLTPYELTSFRDFCAHTGKVWLHRRATVFVPLREAINQDDCISNTPENKKQEEDAYQQWCSDQENSFTAVLNSLIEGGLDPAEIHVGSRKAWVMGENDVLPVDELFTKSLSGAAYGWASIIWRRTGDREFQLVALIEPHLGTLAKQLLDPENQELRDEGMTVYLARTTPDEVRECLPRDIHLNISSVSTAPATL